MYCIIIESISQKPFFSVVKCTNMAAVTSVENHLLQHVVTLTVTTAGDLRSHVASSWSKSCVRISNEQKKPDLDISAFILVCVGELWSIVSEAELMSCQ